MKQLLIPILLLIAYTAQAQSKKEVNKQLKRELSLMQQEERALKQQHDSLTVILNRFKNDITEDGRVLRERQVKEQELSESVKNRYGKLKRLDHQATADSIITYEQWNEMKTEPYHRQQSAMNKLFKPPFAFAQLNDESDQLNDMKVKEQNVYLYELVQRNRAVIDQNKALILREINTASQLDEISVRIDSIYAQSILFINQLERKNNDLQTCLYKLRQNYVNKGPNGFSDAYADIFADVYFEYFAKTDLPPMDEEKYPENDGLMVEDHYMVLPPEEMHVSRPVDPEIFEVVEEQAEFPGGMSALRTYLKENVMLPEAVQSGNVQGKVYVKFIISENGNVSNVKVVKGVLDCKECDAEAVRVVKAMPNWSPAKNNGKKVNSYFNLPVSFAK